MILPDKFFPFGPTARAATAAIFTFVTQFNTPVEPPTITGLGPIDGDFAGGFGRSIVSDGSFFGAEKAFGKVGLLGTWEVTAYAETEPADTILTDVSLSGEILSTQNRTLLPGEPFIGYFTQGDTVEFTAPGGIGFSYEGPKTGYDLTALTDNPLLVLSDDVSTLTINGYRGALVGLTGTWNVETEPGSSLSLAEGLNELEPHQVIDFNVPTGATLSYVDMEQPERPASVPEPTSILALLTAGGIVALAKKRAG